MTTVMASSRVASLSRLFAASAATPLRDILDGKFPRVSAESFDI
jgi:hypothetical protein